VQVQDLQGATYTEAFVISVQDQNEAPTDIALSNDTIAENAAIGTAVGTLSAVDPDAGDTHTFTLVAGTGDEDNDLFQISGNTLQTAAVLDYETSTTHSVRVRATDGGSATYAEAFVIQVIQTNEAPTDIELSNSTIVENAAIGTAVGNLSAVDPDIGDTHTFTLVTGAGSGDNSLFQIVGNELRTAAVLDYETGATRSVRIEADDGLGGTYQESLTLTVLDENESPTDIALSNDMIAENSAIGTVVGTLSAVDPDTEDTHTFALVVGVGDDDNGLFEIDRDKLVTAAVLDYETGATRSVRVRVTDSGSATYTESLIIHVENVNEKPVISNPGSLTNSEGDVVNRQIVVEDPDTASLEYLVSGLPENLTIDNTGLISGSVGYDQAGTHAVTLTVNDGDLSDRVDFEWTILNTNRSPEIPDIENKTGLEGDPVFIAIQAVDPDMEDTLTYSANGLPAGLSINPQTGIISGLLGYDQAGTYHISVTVTDGDLQDQVEFDLLVLDALEPISTWYLPEGFTGNGAQTFILIQNPNSEEANVDMIYMLTDGRVEKREFLVAPNSRFSVFVNDIAQLGPEVAFSTKVEANKKIIVERAMYWPNGDGSRGGHVTTGITNLNTTWYLAEGYTGNNFTTYILIQNPNREAASVGINYMLTDGTEIYRGVIVPPFSRFTVAVHDISQLGPDSAFSTKLVSNLPIAIERAIYFANDGHVSKGISQPQTVWYLAEGFTGYGFGTYILLQNPNLGPATVTIRYMQQGGGVSTKTVTLRGNSRSTIAVQDESQLGVDRVFSTRINSTLPIIVERAMYWPNGDGTIAGHNSPAIEAPSLIWNLAEGFTGDSFETFILVQNPNDKKAELTVTYLLQDGGVIEKVLTVAANSRYTIEAHDESQVGLGVAFSTRIVSNRTVIVERAMYFNNGGHGTPGVID